MDHGAGLTSFGGLEAQTTHEIAGGEKIGYKTKIF